MAMNELDALFDSVDGLKEDLKEYGMIAAAAVGANIAFNFGVEKVLEKVTLPDWAKQYGIPAAAVLAGLVGGKYIAKYNKKAGMGATIGLVAGGISMLVKQLAPSLPLAGLGAQQDEMLLGGGDMYQKYLEGAPTSVEEASGMGGAPVAVEEESMNGFGGAPTSIEDGGFGGFEGAASFM